MSRGSDTLIYSSSATCRLHRATAVAVSGFGGSGPDSQHLRLLCGAQHSFPWPNE